MITDFDPSKRTKMFKFIGMTFNPVVGCGHGCYDGNCWARKLFQLRRKTYHYDWDFSEPHVFPERLKQVPKLRGNVFVCDMGDMFGELVPSRWIGAVLRACQGNREALFFFETKNPARYQEFLGQFPKNSVLSTTIETNRDEYTSWKAPSRATRVLAMKELAWPRKHVSVEPIMDFDMDPFVEIIRSIGPELVSVGYDNYKSGLVEPSLEKTTRFIEQLETFTKVERKELRRGTNE